MIKLTDILNEIEIKPFSKKELADLIKELYMGKDPMRMWGILEKHGCKSEGWGMMLYYWIICLENKEAKYVYDDLLKIK